MISKGACYKIGNGWSINLKGDPWVPGLERNRPHIEEESGQDSMARVASLINLDSMTWNEELVKALYNRDEASAICNLKFPSVTCEDRLCWTASADGRFSVKSCFSIIQKMDSTLDPDRFWGFIWNTGLHERLKLFLWRMVSDVIPTKKVIVDRLGGGDTSCSLFGQEDENAIHLFKYCFVSRAIVFAS